MLSHLFFVDDSFFFFKADFVNYVKMKNLINGYCNARALLSAIPLPLELKNCIANVFGILNSANPGNYLDLPP